MRIILTSIAAIYLLFVTCSNNNAINSDKSFSILKMISDSLILNYGGYANEINSNGPYNLKEYERVNKTNFNLTENLKTYNSISTTYLYNADSIILRTVNLELYEFNNSKTAEKNFGKAYKYIYDKATLKKMEHHVEVPILQIKYLILSKNYCLSINIRGYSINEEEQIKRYIERLFTELTIVQ